MKFNIFSPIEGKKRFGWADIFVIILIFSVLFAAVELGAGMKIPFSETQRPQISLDIIHLPYYAGRSLLRMFLAFAASLIFTFVYGRIAAHHKIAEKIMIPAIDILQSVPVLGFLSVTVIAFMSIFPGQLLGVECASIFAIFTGQVWNMTFSFYHSVSTIPRELNEAAKINKLGSWSRFTKLEVPYSMIGLVWNSMMSFGGGWFFLAASESITVLNQNIQLPGIGSYMATAIVQGNMQAVFYAIVTMVILILFVDQLFWRPIVAWSQKFKNEQTDSSDRPTSWVYDIFKRAKYLNHIIKKSLTGFNNMITIVLRKTKRSNKKITPSSPIAQIMKWAIVGIVSIFILKYMYEGILEISKLSISEIIEVIWYGLLTAARVLVATFLGMIWTIPVGVMIGLQPKLARIAQPIVQILSSFPANMAFPFLTILYFKYGINMEFGAIPLMMLGTQWYILFNVIAGAMSIPTDLHEAAKILRLTRWKTWKTLILPGIFPFLLTGGITASGGAWNASIVSEIVSWKADSLKATGLGSFIADATSKGDWAKIVWGIMVMAILVTVINRLFWRKLYTMAEKKFHIE